MAQSITPPAPFPPHTDEQRAQLLGWISEVSLVYGAWTHFKKLFKASEAAFAENGAEPEILAAFLARLDGAQFHGPQKPNAPLFETFYCDLALHPDASQNLLYAVEGNGAIQVFDVTSPVEPQKLARLTSKKSVWNPTLQCNARFLMLVYSNQVTLYGLENPREPRLIGNFSPNSYHYSLVGDTLVSGYGSLQTFALPTENQAQLTGLGSVADVTFRMMKAGENFVVGQLQRGSQLQIFDLKTPEFPREAGQCQCPNFSDFAVQDRLLVGVNTSKIFAFDLSDLEKPRKIGELAIEGAQKVWIKDGLAVVFYYRWDRNNGAVQRVVFVDISRPHDLRLIGQTNAIIHSSAFVGEFLWTSSWQGTRAFSIADPARAQEVGQKPKDKTFGYLKRRGRRFLRVLAQADEARYFDLMARVVERKKGAKSLDFCVEWMGADIVVNSHDAFEQKHHGRGRIARKEKFLRRDLTMRAAQIWAQNPEKLRAWMGEEFPWQIAVCARKALIASGQNAPDFGAGQLENILWGDWPFAIREAARQISRQSQISTLSPRAIAAYLWASNPKNRRLILSQVETSPAIASDLATLLGQNTDLSSQLSRRGREIALILAARFDLSSREFSAAGAHNTIPALLSAGEAPLRELGLNFCRRLTPEIALQIVSFLPRVAQNMRAAFVDALCESAKKGKFELETLKIAVRHSDAGVRGAVWSIIENSRTEKAVLTELWTGVLRGLTRNYVRDPQRGWYQEWQVSSFLTSALESDAALRILGKAGVTLHEIVRFGYAFWQDPPVPAAVFAAYSLFIEPSQVVDAFAKANDAVWNNWKNAWLHANQLNPKKLADFWSAVRAALDNARFTDAEKARLQARTFSDLQVAATFSQAVSQLEPALLVQLLGMVPDEIWALWRAALLKTLQKDAPRRAAFWEAVRSVGLNELTQKRLVNDADFAATFGLLEEVLEFDDPALEPLLLTWLKVREGNLAREILIESAIHPLGNVRAWSLAQLQNLNLAGALQLLESGLREPMDFAKTWFASQNVQMAALGLCDSPEKSVRVFAREFVTTHLTALLQTDFLAALGENPNAEMQSFVADLLLKNPENAAQTDAFDRTVLRGRNRARRAKDLVQTRRATTPLGDEKTLLELARGKTPRDADFAWTQLAKRALEGENNENVAVKGVAAI